MTPSTLILFGAAGASLLMIVLWLIELRIGDASHVDVGWSGAIGLLAVFFALAADGHPLQRWLAGGLTGLWSLRLTIYLLRDRILGKPEDGRYRTLRAEWGERAHLGFFFFFQAQGLLALLFALPALIIALAPAAPSWPRAAAAIALWLVAVLAETTADRQLAAFRADPATRGTTCRRGLWAFSRHPNYFFEWLHWWVYPLLGLGAPWGWLTLFAPVLMFVFIWFITGIPATERQALLSRPDYRDYQRSVSPFIPWFPRRDGSGG